MKDEQNEPPWWVWMIIWLLLVATVIVGLIVLDNDFDESGSRPPTSTVITTPPTVWQTTNLPPPLTDAATVTKPAVRADFQIQLTEPPAPIRPKAIPGDCGSWQAIFRWYGATDEEIYFFFVSTPWGRRNVISAESMCGLRFRNPDTSDTGICQLNGVHRDWVMAEFGLRIGYASHPKYDVSETEASNPEYARACLYLLRGMSYEPNAFGLACSWRVGRFCS